MALSNFFSFSEKALPTAECPHQYGFFPSPRATPEDCGLYLMCVEGKAIEMSCPPGLAFNPSNARCDWPDAVPSCNADGIYLPLIYLIFHTFVRIA